MFDRWLYNFYGYMPISLIINKLDLLVNARKSFNYDMYAMRKDLYIQLISAYHHIQFLLDSLNS